MPTESTSSINPLAGVHDPFIGTRMPAWLLNASADQRQHYFKALRGQAVAVRTAAELFARAGTLTEFAAERLTAALQQRFSLTLDIHTVELVRFEAVQSFPVHRDRAHRQSLLQAALANFSAAEAQPGAWQDRGWIAPAHATTTSIGRPAHAGLMVLSIAREAILPVPLEAFADCCRRLDIGAQYQAHLRSIFAMNSPASGAFRGFREHLTACLRVQVHVALMSKNLSPAACRMLLGMLDKPAAPFMWGDAPAELAWLEMLGSAFHSAHLVSGAFVVQRSDKQECVVYLPGDPQHPIKQYPSLQAFATELCGRLRQAPFRQFFLKLISQRRGEVFESRLLSALNAAAKADLGLEAVPIERPLVDVLYTHAMVKIAEDARFHAVPAADCDQKARDERLARLRTRGVNVLNLLGLFVPSLGVAMGVYGALGLLEDVFEGVDDWQHGQVKTAIGHLEAIAESLATGVALGKLTSAEFIGQLVPVSIKGGAQRLWRPDIQAYRSRARLPAHVVADGQGVLRHAGQAFIQLEGGLHEVIEPAAVGVPWSLRPPYTGRYAVPLEHNGQGAWRYAQENPLAWEGAALMARWGYRTHGYSQALLKDLRDISGVSEQQLRQALFRNEPMPAILADLLDRHESSNTPFTDGQPSFGERYRAKELAAPWNTPIAAPLRASFPGLPTRLVEALVATATDAERRTLLLGRVPLRLAEQGRLQLREVRVMRALEALYYDRQGEPDAWRLALQMLPLTDAWPKGAALQLRSDSITGAIVQQVGDPAAQAHRRLVAVAGQYLAYGGHDELLGQSPNLFEALDTIVRDVAALGEEGAWVEGPEALQAQIFDAALAHRERLPQALGMQPLQRPFVAPQRQFDGRVGYPLSGRRVGSWDTRQRLHRLFPIASDLELIRLRQELGLNAFNAGRILTQLEMEQQVLRQSLQSWAQMPTTVQDANGVEQTIAPASRLQAAQRIEAAWRRETSIFDPMRRNDYANGYSLDLSGLEVGPLPAMVARFDHIRSLRMDSMQLRRDPSQFLSLFTNLRRLTLYNNGLRQIPAQIARLPQLVHCDLGHNAFEVVSGLFTPLRGHPALRGLSLDQAVARLTGALFADIATIPRLEHLDLARNQLQLTTEAWQHLAAVPHLRAIDLAHNQITLDAQTSQLVPALAHLRELRLNNNPLGHPPALRGLNQLERLNLADTQIDSWPDGLIGLMNLPQSGRIRRIDLSRNRLTRVPPLQDTEFVRARSWLLGRVTHRFNINGNPLSEESLALLHAAHLEVSVSTAPQVHWLFDCPPEIRDRIEQLRADADSEPFYLALSRVADTADYRADPIGMRRRMWAVAQAILEPAAREVPVGWGDLRRHLFLLAEDATQTCGDGISLLLNQFETSIHLWRTASTEGASSVVRESERVFRLAMVDECAIRIAQRRIDRRLALRQVPPPSQLPGLDPMDAINDADLYTTVDEAEIRLVLRRRMAARLPLPPQPEQMLYGELVEEQTLQQLQLHIESAATFEALRDWLQDEVAWQFYIERTEAARFDVFEQGWGYASELFEAATAADGVLPSAQGVPPAALSALQDAAPHLRWLDEQGALLRVETNSAEYNDLYIALANARSAARRELLQALGEPLLQNHCQLPRQLPK